MMKHFVVGKRPQILPLTLVENNSCPLLLSQMALVRHFGLRCLIRGQDNIVRGNVGYFVAFRADIDDRYRTAPVFICLEFNISKEKYTLQKLLITYVPIWLSQP